SWQVSMEVLRSCIAGAGAADRLAKRIAEAATPYESATDASTGVFIGTIHAAKGLEWDNVFLAACQEGVLPHSKAGHLEEERRLAFVAVTRARENLAITWSEARGLEPSQPSRFIAELTHGLPAGSVRR